MANKGLLLMLAAAAGGVALLKSKKAKAAEGGGSRGVVALDEEDLARNPSVSLGGGERLIVQVKGLSEQWRVELTGGGAHNMDDILRVDKIAERGDVTFTFTPLGKDSFDMAAKFVLVGQPQGTVLISYTP